MEKLIALVDGSIYSESVCDNAAWISGRTNAEIELMHVIGRREVSAAPRNLSGNISLGARTTLLNELSELDAQRAQLSQKLGRAILDGAEARIIAQGPKNVTARLRIGDLVEAVSEQEFDAEIIVIGKRGEAADFAKLHLGSNLERTARVSTKPVYVAARAFSPIKRFMIAYDGGTSATKAVDYVARSPLFSGLECCLLIIGAENDENQKRLDYAQAILEAGSFEVDAKILPGQPDVAITGAVESHNIDLLVMGAYGHSRIRNLIIGSTTSEMVRSCKIPVVLFR
jgi:nucleotide-binding universal stress UspA family protein